MLCTDRGRGEGCCVHSGIEVEVDKRGSELGQPEKNIYVFLFLFLLLLARSSALHRKGPQRDAQPVVICGAGAVVPRVVSEQVLPEPADWVDRLDGLGPTVFRGRQIARALIGVAIHGLEKLGQRLEQHGQDGIGKERTPLGRDARERIRVEHLGEQRGRERRVGLAPRSHFCGKKRKKR